jgi:hypothetical protein
MTKIATLLAAVGLAALAAPASAQDTENLPSAVMSQSVIDAAPDAEVEQLRQFMRDGTEDNYPDKQAACAELTSLIVPQ